MAKKGKKGKGGKDDKKDKLKKLPKEKPAIMVKLDMQTDMQKDAVDCARLAMTKFNQEKDIAGFLKKEFDKKFGGTWQCIVGRNFGSYVSHQCRHYIYFFLNYRSFLIFKTC